VSHRAEPVVVASAHDGVTGAIIAGTLESAGIPVEIRCIGAGWLYPGVQANSGPVEVLVPAECGVDARAILEAAVSGV